MPPRRPRRSPRRARRAAGAPAARRRPASTARLGARARRAPAPAARPDIAGAGDQDVELGPLRSVAHLHHRRLAATGVRLDSSPSLVGKLALRGARRKSMMARPIETRFSTFSTSSRSNTICSVVAARRSTGSASSAARSSARRWSPPRAPSSPTARAFAARLFHAARRSHGADHLRGRPHPRRRQLHHAPRGGDPARPGDLLAGGLVPGRRGGPRASDRHARACRRPKTCRASADARGSRSRRARRRPCAATGSASGRSRCARSICATMSAASKLRPEAERLDPRHRPASRRSRASTDACSPMSPT